ncbi:BON domain-containing protein [Alphaproteobacteria bacterium LSUCC0684]
MAAARPSGSSISLITGFFLLALSLGLSGCVGAIAGVGAAAVAAGSTEKGLGTSFSDSIIRVKLADAFVQQDVGLFSDVSAKVNNGSVLLTGNVQTPEDKVEATKLTWQVRGVIEVINEIEVKDTSTLKDMAKDVAAAAQMRAKLIGDKDISSINFSVDVVNGTVFLSGIASSEAEMLAVVDHARELRFAQEVVNYIRVNDDDRQ